MIEDSFDEYSEGPSFKKKGKKYEDAPMKEPPRVFEKKWEQEM